MIFVIFVTFCKFCDSLLLISVSFYDFFHKVYEIFRVICSSMLISTTKQKANQENGSTNTEYSTSGNRDNNMESALRTGPDGFRIYLVSKSNSSEIFIVYSTLYFCN